MYKLIDIETNRVIPVGSPVKTITTGETWTLEAVYEKTIEVSRDGFKRKLMPSVVGGKIR